MPDILSRSQLYELVWSQPMQKLAKEFGVSDVALAKSCRNAEIPLPERGYWNKLSAGKPVTKTPLPPADLGTPWHVHVAGSISPAIRQRLAPEDIYPDDDSDLQVLAERFAKRLGKVSVPAGLQSPHPLIAKLLAKDERLRTKQSERPHFRSFYKPKLESPFERRRLRILNAIFRAADRMGGHGSIRDDLARELSVSFGGGGIAFTVDAIGAPRGADGVRAKLDRLILRFDGHGAPARSQLDWRDEDGATLEAQLTEIVNAMALAAECARRARDRAHRRWLQEQEKARAEEERRRAAEAARKERERRAALACQRIDELLSDAENQERARRLRAYVELALRSPPAGVDPTDLSRWAETVRAIADTLDPFVSGRLAKSIGDLSSELQEK